MKPSRTTPVHIPKEEFQKMGHALVDAIAAFIDTIDQKPVTPGESPAQVRAVLGQAPLPEKGRPAPELLQEATDLLLQHSLLNGHPRFMGYITSSATPIGALADLLAAAVNPNVGANILSPMATAIEQQTIQWIAELIGYAPHCGGILVSGGNMANFTAFLAARTAKAPKTLKEEGLGSLPAELTIYCSATTHTWIEKAAVLFGHGTKAIRWISTDAQNRMDNAMLQEAIKNDLRAGKKPFLVVGTAGDVSTGVVDDLRGIADICKKYDCWFHIDGAYGIPAAALPGLKKLFDGMEEADSIALDPHKWLYSPLEAGCTLVKDPNHLVDTYSSHPVYFNFDIGEAFTQNFYEYGFQNSRGFRALKVWLGLQQAGRSGQVAMIEEDIRLAELFYSLADTHPELEALTQNLSITTLRYVPPGWETGSEEMEARLNKLNEDLLNVLQQGGDVFLSNALVQGKYCLRGCIVNFRTSEKDIRAIVDIIVREGRKLQAMQESKTAELV